MLRMMIDWWGKRIMKHKFLKHALWTALFVAGAALAQDAAISGADFTHGKADAQLAAIGSKAAATGQTVVVTAPTYWQGKAAAKIRAGAHGKPVVVRFSNGFYENVLVRTEAAAPAEAVVKPAAKPVARPEAKPEPKVATKVEPRATARVAETEPKTEVTAASGPERIAAVAAPAPKPVEAPPISAPMVMQAPAQQAPAGASPPPPPATASNIVAVPQVSHQPAVVPIPTAAINSTGAKPMIEEAQGGNDDARQQMLASLNEGRPAMGSLTESQLRLGDQVYAHGTTLAAVRMEGLHRDLYWLQGPVDLQRVQFMPQGENHYQVTGPIDTKAPAAHRSAANGPRVVESKIPATGSAARARLERQYNNGQPITGDLAAARLQPEDRLLVDGGAIIVARREGNSMARYWLDGSIDLGQSGLQKVDANVYRVTGDSLH
jgi:hypothetical protein